ncbi:hypothetical protein CHUAL_004963 [Chamberlinius hualienensis]
MQLVLNTFVVLAALVAAPSAVFGDRCADIKLGEIDYELMQKYSPFYLQVSTVGGYNCSQVLYVGPAGERDDYTGTSIVIIGDKSLSYDITLKDSVFSATVCADGTPAGYKVLFSNLVSSEEASFCVFSCDESGDNIALLACPGRTTADLVYINNYIKNELKVTITGDIYQSQSGCPKAKFCASYS